MNTAAKLLRNRNLIAKHFCRRFPRGQFELAAASEMRVQPDKNCCAGVTQDWDQ